MHYYPYYASNNNVKRTLSKIFPSSTRHCSLYKYAHVSTTTSWNVERCNFKVKTEKYRFAMVSNQIQNVLTTYGERNYDRNEKRKKLNYNIFASDINQAIKFLWLAGIEPHSVLFNAIRYIHT